MITEFGAMALLRSGHTPEAIAQEAGVDPKWVRRLANRIEMERKDAARELRARKRQEREAVTATRNTNRLEAKTAKAAAREARRIAREQANEAIAAARAAQRKRKEAQQREREHDARAIGASPHTRQEERDAAAAVADQVRVETRLKRAAFDEALSVPAPEDHDEYGNATPAEEARGIADRRLREDENVRGQAYIALKQITKPKGWEPAWQSWMQ